MEILVKKSNRFLNVALASAFGLLASSHSFADGRLNDLKKRKMDLDQLSTKCETMSDESSKSDCLAKRQKKVDQYREDLNNYKSDLAKEHSKASQREAKDNPDDFAPVLPRSQ